MPSQQPDAPDAEHARGSEVFGTRDRRCKRLTQTREVRCDRDRDADHRSLRADADDGRNEDRNEQRRKRDGQVDEPGHEPTDAPAHERRHRPERNANQRPEAGRENRERHGQARRDEHPMEDVPAEGVGAEPVGAARALRRVQDVETRRFGRPEDGRDDREGDDRGEAECRRDPDRRP